MTDILWPGRRGRSLDPTVLAVIAAAAVYGTLFGSIPGLSATMAVALIVPLTYFLSPLAALAAVVTLEAVRHLGRRHSQCARAHPGHPGVGRVRRRPLPTRSTRAVPPGARCLHHVQRHRRALRCRGPLPVRTAVRGIATWFTVAESFWLYVLGLGCAVVVSRGSALKGALALLSGCCSRLSA